MRRVREFDHIFLDHLAPDAHAYSRPRQKIERPPFKRPNPDIQGPKLSRQLSSLRAYFAKLRERRKAANLTSVKESYLSVDYNPRGVGKVQSFTDKKKSIEIALVRQDTANPNKATAVLRLGEGDLKPLENKVKNYLDPSKESEKGMRRSEDLLGGVKAFRQAALDDFWTSESPPPTDDGREIYWEIWLSGDVDLDWFKRQALRAKLTVSADHILQFPGRKVVLGHGTRRAVEKVLRHLGQIMELREPSVVKDFAEMDAVEQYQWIEDLALEGPDEDACSICLLDDGLDHSHPLIQPAVSPGQVLAYHPAWGTLDRDKGHGTMMAGILVFGEDLGEKLVELKAPVKAPCFIESVKILPEPPGRNEERLYGEVTQASIAAAEVAKAADRVFCMAVTAEASTTGSPSAWSAAVDQSCFGTDEQDSPKRLITISAGNAAWEDPTYSYPDYNLTDSVQDPAQCWNALIVGGFTNQVSYDIDEYPDWAPVAELGKLSPTSTTSTSWDKTWPDRPDVVMEGGNLLSDGASHLLPDCLSLLTARRRRTARDRLLTSFAETSCATALAARLCGQIKNQHPRRWPETIRGLVVHSARWTEGMKKEFSGLTGKGPYRNLLRTVGMGVPDLQRALHSAKDSVTLVTENTMYPFDEQGRLNELHLHDLPWPKRELEELGSAAVRMRVTLSYFIDPRPGRRDFKTKYNYASHGLRFEVKTAEESLDQFLARINEKAKSGKPKSKSDTKDWMVGPEIRDRGSLHSDVWCGTAQQLIDKEFLAVIPVKGWWADDASKRTSRARYSLIISIETAELNTDIDFYTEIETVVESRVEAEARTEVELDGFEDADD